MPIASENQAGGGRASNILVSSAARKVPLVMSVKAAAVRISPDIAVYAGDIDPDCPAGLVVDGLILMPRTVAGDREAIRDLLVQKGIGVVIPTRDGELMFWAENRSFFAESGVDVVVSPPGAIQLTLDKRAFSEHGRNRHLPVIPVFDVPFGEGPFVVKERYGAGSASIGLRLAEADVQQHARALEDPLIQPFVEGVESSADAWFDREHRLKGIILRTRDEVVNGEARVTTTYRDAKTESEISSVLDSIGLRGPVVAQFLRDRVGGVHVIEVNPRFGGATTASIAAGLDVWHWTLLESYGADLDESPFHRIESEIRQVRVPWDLHTEVRP